MVNKTVVVEEARNPKPKKLFRSEEDRVIGGVAGGLGKYFSVDPNIIRILFIVSSFLLGAGILLYLLLWLFLPSESNLEEGIGGRINTFTKNLGCPTPPPPKKEGESPSLRVEVAPSTPPSPPPPVSNRLKIWVSIIMIALGTFLTIATGLGFFNFLGLANPALIPIIVVLLLLAILIA